MDGGTPRLAWIILAFYFALVCVTALSHIVPLTFDEAWSFLEFSRHGVGFSLTHYPLPNNHLAFSALQALVVREPFVAAEPTLLRLGNLLCVAALLLLLRHIAKHRLDLSASASALAAVAFSLCSPLFTLYLFVGRGYLLGSVLLLAAVHLGAIPGRRVATALLCALATWTVPTFAFAAPGVLLALLLTAGRGREGWRAVAQASAIYAVATLTLYSPVIGDVLAQRSGWNEASTPLASAKLLWDLLGNSGVFGLSLVSNALLLTLLALATWRGQQRAESIALLAPVVSFIAIAGLLAATGVTATPFVRTLSFAPLFVWLALAVAVRGSLLRQRTAGVLIAFNAIAGIALFTATLGTGDPQQYPLLAELSPSPLARADRSWLAKGAVVKMEWDAVPVGRLYARGYQFKLKRVDRLAKRPCAEGGRFPPRAKNRIAIAGDSQLICF